MKSGGEAPRGFAALLRDLANGSADLFRGEARLARLELARLGAGIARGTVQAALGAVLLVLGGLAVATGVVLLVGDQWLPSDRYWLAALVVAAITGGLAAWFARRGLSHLAPPEILPDQTLETLKEDKAWLKQQLTSGATSS
jgi:hypothetical protein